jgi:zinc protease
MQESASPVASTLSVAPARTPALGPDSVTRQVLPNGLVVLIYPNPAIPTVSVRLSMRAGALFDPPGKSGVAGLTAGAMRRGTRRHTFSDLNERTEERGMSLGLDAGLHLLEIGGRSLREDAPFLLETLAEVLREPSFPADEVERLRSQLITGLLEQEDDTRSVADRDFRAAAYPDGHPYGREAGGSLESVRTITRQDLEDHYRAYVRPDTGILVIVGDITPEAGLDLARQALGDWQVDGGAPALVIPDAPQPAETREVQHFLAGKTQNDLVLGFPALRRTDPDYYAMEMMNLILGRLGLYGRLGKSVREDQGLAYYAYSGLEAGLGAGPWAVRAGVNPANVRRAVASILTEIRRMQDEPVRAQELDAGRRFLTGTLPLRLETNNGLVRQILEIELYGLGWDYIQRYPEIVNSLTVEDVQRVARSYLHPNRFVLAIAGPTVPETAPAEAVAPEDTAAQG